VYHLYGCRVRYDSESSGSLHAEGTHDVSIMSNWQFKARASAEVLPQDCHGSPFLGTGTEMEWTRRMMRIKGMVIKMRLPIYRRSSVEKRTCLEDSREVSSSNDSSLLL
jgi:hypothetical protein